MLFPGHKLLLDGTLSLEWGLAMAYLAGGLNDLFLDLVFFCRPLRQAIAQGRENPHCDEEELHRGDEKSIAILIPAWDESTVIGAMLESTCDRLDYANYDIFVGTYPNDEATQFEVARAAFDRPRIHRIVCPNAGPTSKADCLNWIVEAIKLHESETGRRYEIFVLEDAEDVVHPLTLKVFNRFIPEYDLIQLPVIPYERPLHQMTGNTYLDEFAEVHLKGLTSRLAVGGMVPSAGVGTGFSRAACDELAEQTNHVLFPPVSLTEDYEFSFRLFRNRRRSGLAEVWVDRTDAQGRHVKELVAIREFFPNVFIDAVRQKQRWLLGITFQGAQKLGWGTGWRERYMLLRDRVGVVTSLLNLVAAFIFFRLGEQMVESHLHHMPWTSGMPAYDAGSALAVVIDVNLLLLANRLLQRAVFVSRVARRRQVLATPFRMLWGNVIDFYCAVHAVRRFVHSEWTGKPLKWMKTAHEFPNVETLLRRHRPLGDILLERRSVSPDQLREALTLQQRPAFRDRYLGEILAELCAITQDQLLEALSLQTTAKVAFGAQGGEIVMMDEAMPLVINQVVGPPAALKPSLYPSQLTAASSPHLFVALQPHAADACGAAYDPVARAARRTPQPRGVLRTSHFAGAAARPRSRGPAKWPAVAGASRLPDARRPAAAVLPLDEQLEAQGELTIRIADGAEVSRPRPGFAACGERFSMLHAIANGLAAQQLEATTMLPAAGGKRFVVAIGTRPEAIKLAPLIFELRARAAAENRHDDVFVCTTGQHQDLVREPLEQFGIVPDLDLGLMQPAQTLAGLSSRVLDAFARVLERVRPEWVIVQGDTATTAMAALASFYAGIKIAHVEAGLRTHDLRNPFPEEANRRIVSVIASTHFAATDQARYNLLREGVDERAIHVTGNTGIDALRLHCERIGLPLGVPGVSPEPSLRGPWKVLVTAHRRENLGGGIHDLCQAIHSLIERCPGRFHFVWPLHPNPQVMELARGYLAGLPDVSLSGPVPYDRLLSLLADCDLVLTDSGGLQEEAPSFGKPVLILREATERPEGVTAGIARLIGTRPDEIEAAVMDAAEELERAREERARTSWLGGGGRALEASAPENPYGDGQASMRIADFFSDLPVHEFVDERAVAQLQAY